MKARVVYGPVGYYEVEVKTSIIGFWKTVYNGNFPWRGSKNEAIKLAKKLNK